MAVELKVPSLGESIAEIEIGDWLKSVGEEVQEDEPVAVLESEKATVELPAPRSGVISNILKKKGEKASVGEVIGYLEEGTEKGKDREERGVEGKQIEEAEATKEKEPEWGEKVGELRKRKDEKRWKEELEERKKTQAVEAREEEVIPMSLLRRRIAERLVEAQRNQALLTTFNEIDMSEVIAMRERYAKSFEERHRIRLGIMSFFVKASVEALKLVPQVNAEIRGSDVVYRNYYDIGIAVGGGRGLVVPVLRNAERTSFAEIEAAIHDFARRARENKLKPDELQGGTFTITNGGVYGSLLSTPIINPPQSGILGMHVIQDRPVAHGGQIALRPMMYVALTYDHRIVDGREAVTFLKRIKECVECPSRILLET